MCSHLFAATSRRAVEAGQAARRPGLTGLLPYSYLNERVGYQSMILLPVSPTSCVHRL